MEKMKRYNLLIILISGLFAIMVTSCENQEAEFPDFDYSTVYFAYQYPVRTIVLGEDIVDNTLDNEYKCKIFATMGGVYANSKMVSIDVAVDNNLCNNLFFNTGQTLPVQAMPANYYTLAGNQITLDKALQGGVVVQLSEAFFADPKALTNNYVIPLRMTKVVNADSILSGKAKLSVSNPVRVNSADWDIQPKDFTLYCLKFINPWHANYLRRGRDIITQGGSSVTNIRRKQYVENDEVVNMKTVSLNSVELPVTVVNASSVNETCRLLLTFNAQGNCTISTTTSGFTVTGNGSFVKKGEKKSWGNKDRDAIYLDYTISMTGKTYATRDTLVVRDRGVKIETFTPSFKVN